MAAEGVEQSLIQSGHGVVFGFASHACGLCCYKHNCIQLYLSSRFPTAGTHVILATPLVSLAVPHIAVAFLSNVVKVLAVVLPESFA